MPDASGKLPEPLDTHVRDAEDAYWSRRAAGALADKEPTVSWADAVAELEA